MDPKRSATTKDPVPSTTRARIQSAQDQVGVHNTRKRRRAAKCPHLVPRKATTERRAGRSPSPARDTEDTYPSHRKGRANSGVQEVPRSNSKSQVAPRRQNNVKNARCRRTTSMHCAKVPQPSRMRANLALNTRQRYGQVGKQDLKKVKRDQKRHMQKGLQTAQHRPGPCERWRSPNE